MKNNKKRQFVSQKVRECTFGSGTMTYSGLFSVSPCFKRSFSMTRHGRSYRSHSSRTRSVSFFKFVGLEISKGAKYVSEKRCYTGCYMFDATYLATTKSIPLQLRNKISLKIVRCNISLKLRLHTAINRVDFVSWCIREKMTLHVLSRLTY